MKKYLYGFFLTTTNAFTITPTSINGINGINSINGINTYIPMLNIKMNYKPQEMLQNLGQGQLGNEWTYEDFASNQQIFFHLSLFMD